MLKWLALCVLLSNSCLLLAATENSSTRVKSIKEVTITPLLTAVKKIQYLQFVTQNANAHLQSTAESTSQHVQAITDTAENHLQNLIKATRTHLQIATRKTKSASIQLLNKTEKSRYHLLTLAENSSSQLKKSTEATRNHLQTAIDNVSNHLQVTAKTFSKQVKNISKTSHTHLTNTSKAANEYFLRFGNALNPYYSSLPGRLSANGLISDYLVGQADLMVPLMGDNTHNLYIDPDIAYGSDEQGYADLGIGYRWLQNNAAILGVYLFAGYTRIDNDARLWVANPGVEALGSRWDAHLNAYFSVGDRNYTTGNVTSFAGHSQFNSLLVQYVGNGIDVKFGYQLFPQVPLKATVGSYFFTPAETNNIWGGAAGVEYWLNSQVKVFASYTYDAVRRSTAAVGLGIELGGTHVHRSDPSMEERITDPVERYLAELGRGSAIPSRKIVQYPTLVFNNIAFFSQSGMPNTGGGLTIDNCTFENPCGPLDFSQTNVDNLNTLLSNTRMYFNGGIYPSTTGANIILNNGQSLHSRTADYTQPATGAERSTFYGTLTLNGNNTLENIILLPTTPGTGTGVSANDATNLLITGSQIGDTTNRFSTGVSLTGNSQLTMQTTNVFASSVAMTISNNSTLNLISSNLETNGPGNTTLLANDDSVTFISGSTITNRGFGGTAVRSTGRSQITVTNSQINVLNGNDTAGIDASNFSSIAASNSTVNVTGTATGNIGAIARNNSKITFNTSTINVVGAANNNVGLRTNVISKIISNNTTVNVNSGTGDSSGIVAEAGTNQIFDNGTLTVNGGAGSILTTIGATNIQILSSVCTLNGSTITCP